jgi:hypothetical protein
MSLKKGMAGLILLVMVLGYMMVISTSSTMLVQTESMGKNVRSGYKALYAAKGGLGIVMAKLRSDPDAFDANIALRPYFTRAPAPDTENHWADWGGGGYQNYPGSNHLNPGWVNIASNFSNPDIEEDNYLVILNTYPGDQTDPDEENAYYAKCQGKYEDPGTGRVFTAQVWGRFIINGPSKLVVLETHGIMGVQSLELNDTDDGINDFWDWQKNF